MLSQSNELWDDVPWVEANELAGHTGTYRTSIPTGAWRQVNQGTPYGKSTTAQFTIGTGVLEGYSQIDRLVAERSGDVERFRRTEDVAFLEGMGQTFTQTFFYGNTAATPAEFMGASTFYNTVSTGSAQNAANVIDAGGTGSSNLSFWLYLWGEDAVYCIFPRGSQAGLTMENKGTERAAYDALGNPYEAYTSWFRQQGGFVPQDWRCGARIANVDVTAAGLAGPNPYDIFAGFAQLMYLPPALGKRASGITRVDAEDDPMPGKRAVIYTNRTGRHWMDVQIIRDRNVLISINDYDGRVCESYRGIPIKIVDQLTISEGRVT